MDKLKSTLKGLKSKSMAGNVSSSVLLMACFLFLAVHCLAQQPSPATPRGNAAQAPPKGNAVQAPPAPESESGEQGQTPLPGDWAPELLDGILSSPNAQASDSLFRAAFAAGPSIVLQLAEALKDDRTAEYAAQSLAFIGGEQAMQTLWKLQEDKRDLNLRRFYYGALAEYDSDPATQTLFQVIDKSDAEPDRTVTEAAIMALTVRTDPKLADRIRLSEKKVSDVVIRDDLENALDIIELRSKFLATPEGRKASGSVDAAIRTYFLPALQPPPPPPSNGEAHHAPRSPRSRWRFRTLPSRRTNSGRSRP